MVATDPMGVAVLALGATVWLGCAIYGARELRLAASVLRSDPDSALDATDGGPIELRGRARSAGRVVRSPFTDAPCLAFEYEVEEERNTKHGTSWTTIESGHEYVPFLLEDDAGAVLVEPPGADLRLTRERRIEVDGGTTPPDPVRSFVRRTGAVDCQDTSLELGPFELSTGKDRRYVERRLDVGERVHVLGTARYDTTVGRRAGQVNAAVGIDERARGAGRLGWLRYRLFGYPFVISDRSERGLGLRAGAIGAGVVLGATLGLWLLVGWLG